MNWDLRQKYRPHVLRLCKKCSIIPETQWDSGRRLVTRVRPLRFGCRVSRVLPSLQKVEGMGCSAKDHAVSAFNYGYRRLTLPGIEICWAEPNAFSI